MTTALYHCGECKMVKFLDREDLTFRGSCKVCGEINVFYKIEMGVLR